MKLIQALSSLLFLSASVQSRLFNKYVSKLVKEEAGLVKDTLKEGAISAKDIVQEKVGPVKQKVEDETKGYKKIAEDVAVSYEKKLEKGAGLYKDMLEGEVGSMIKQLGDEAESYKGTMEEEAAMFFNTTMNEVKSVKNIFEDEAGSLRKKLNKEAKSYESVLKDQAAGFYNATMEEGESVKETLEDVFGDFLDEAAAPFLCTVHMDRESCFTSSNATKSGVSCQWCTSSVVKEEVGACMSDAQVDDIAAELSLKCEHGKKDRFDEVGVDGGDIFEKHFDGPDDSVDEDTRKEPRKIVYWKQNVKKFNL